MRRKYIPLMTAAIFPYLVLLGIFCCFSNFLMERVFRNNAYLLLLCLLMIWVGSFLLVTGICTVGAGKRWTALELAKANMVVKLVQIPAYVLIFLMGLACTITIFTIGFTVVFFFLDCLSIVLTGLIGLGAAKLGCREGILSKKETLLYGVLPFLFCLDVICAIVLFRKVKRAGVNGLRSVGENTG